MSFISGGQKKRSSVFKKARSDKISKIDTQKIQPRPTEFPRPVRHSHHPWLSTLARSAPSSFMTAERWPSAIQRRTKAWMSTLMEAPGELNIAHRGERSEPKIFLFTHPTAILLFLQIARKSCLSGRDKQGYYTDCWPYRSQPVGGHAHGCVCAMVTH